MTGVAREAYNLEPAMNSASWTLLVQLKEAHEQLFREIANLDALTRGSQPEDSQFARARWQISQASLRRRTLAARIDDFLSARVGGQDLIQLRTLKGSDQQLLRQSAQHVATWTMHRTRQDWASYCNASCELQIRMKAHLLVERRMLEPLLMRLAHQGI